MKQNDEKIGKNNYKFNKIINWTWNEGWTKLNWSLRDYETKLCRETKLRSNDYEWELNWIKVERFWMRVELNRSWTNDSEWELKWIEFERF
jgi:hypothetical protein